MHIRGEHIRDHSGQLDERNSSSAHTEKDQHVPKAHFEIASGNEFRRAINEDDIDFNIPGPPHSAVKQSDGTKVQDVIHKIEKTLIDMHLKTIFNKKTLPSFQ